MRDDSQKRAEEARVAYDEALTAFKNAIVSLAELADIIATFRDELRNDVLAAQIRRAIIGALWRHRQIKRRHAKPEAVFDVTIADYPRQELLNQAADIETRVNALTAEADSPARAALLAEKIELADRQWLHSIKADVLTEIERRKQVERLETIQRDTTTNRITTKSTEVAQALVTDALRAQFAREVASFGIADIAVELRQQSSIQGIPRFQAILIRPTKKLHSY